MQKRLSLHLFPAAAEEGSPEGAPGGARGGGAPRGGGGLSRGQPRCPLSAEDITPANPFYKSIAFFLLCCKRKKDIITADHKIGVRMPLPIKEMFA